MKDVETEVNKVEMSFSFDPQSCTLKVCINQAVIQTAYSKRYPNPYVTGYVCNCSNYITYALCGMHKRNVHNNNVPHGIICMSTDNIIADTLYHKEHYTHMGICITPKA